MFLDDESGMAVVGLSDRLSCLLTQLEASEPDVLLLDWSQPVQPIVDLLTNPHNLERPPKVVVFSTSEEKETIMAAGGRPGDPYDESMPPGPVGLPEHMEILFGVTDPADR